MSIGKWSPTSPAITFSAASMIAFACSASISPSEWLARAQASFTRPKDRMKASGMGRPEIGKLFTARWVWAPQRASAGTSSSPMLSDSVLVFIGVRRFVVSSFGRFVAGTVRRLSGVVVYAVAVLDVVAEAQVLTFEVQHEITGCAVAVLADDDLGLALVRRIVVVDFITVNEQDHVGILLDGAGFTQVGHHRPLVGPLLQRAVELGKRDDRYLELLGKRLEAARDLSDLGGAVLLVSGHLHQLEVVDHDHADVVLALHPAGPGAQFSRRKRRRLVDVDVGLLEHVHRRLQIGVVGRFKLRTGKLEAPDCRLA